MRYAYRGNNIVYRTVYRNVFLKIYISLSSDIYRENQTLKTPENNMYSRCDTSYRTVYRNCILDRMYFEVHRARTQPEGHGIL